MDWHLAWGITQTLGHGLLELLRIATAWPVMMVVAIVLVYRKFQEPIGSLIKHGTWSAKMGGGEFASQGVQLGQPTSADNPSDILDGSATEGSAPPSDIESPTASFEQIRAFARTHYCMHMELVLAAKTKALLIWVQSLGHVDFSAFESVVQAVSAGETEATNIRQVIFNNGLALVESGAVRLQPLGSMYLEWRLQANLLQPPSIGTFIVQDPPPTSNS